MGKKVPSRWSRSEDFGTRYLVDAANSACQCYSDVGGTLEDGESSGDRRQMDRHLTSIVAGSSMHK